MLQLAPPLVWMSNRSRCPSFINVLEEGPKLRLKQIMMQAYKWTLDYGNNRLNTCFLKLSVDIQVKWWQNIWKYPTACKRMNWFLQWFFVVVVTRHKMS